uniref:Uncharacterized protein n=1 Tax=Timema douglasi TaxID=61478 RepID=A0A7R8VJK2_TIMDO|nr:unnamed protein product [Timema douglasi]
MFVFVSYCRVSIKPYQLQWPYGLSKNQPKISALDDKATEAEISPNALEDDEPFHGFEVNDEPMLDVGERQAHQGATGTESDMLFERGPGRPKLMGTGRRVRPTKIYQPADNRADRKLALNNDLPYDKDAGHSSIASSQQTMEHNNNTPLLNWFTVCRGLNLIRIHLELVYNERLNFVVFSSNIHANVDAIALHYLNHLHGLGVYVTLLQHGKEEVVSLTKPAPVNSFRLVYNKPEMHLAAKSTLD